jgi:hypothetical protein
LELEKQKKFNGIYDEIDKVVLEAAKRGFFNFQYKYKIYSYFNERENQKTEKEISENIILEYRGENYWVK